MESESQRLECFLRAGRGLRLLLLLGDGVGRQRLLLLALLPHQLALLVRRDVLVDVLLARLSRRRSHPWGDIG